MHATLYDSLDPRKRELRFLHFYTSPEHDDLIWEMKVASLDDDPSYLALSYTWGDGALTGPIKINSTEVYITCNLKSPLLDWARQILGGPDFEEWPFHDWPVWLWVDAICINQVDQDEKSIQIQLMGEI